jgi:hypothetical protein
VLIHQLAAAGRVDQIIDLLAQDADPDALDGLDSTALIAALRAATARHRRGEPVDAQLAAAGLLLAHGTDTARRDRLGRTAGEWATGLPGVAAVPGLTGLPGWLPEPAFDPWTSALLTLLRRDRGAWPPGHPTGTTGDEVATWPPALRAMVPLLGARPVVWIRLGYWEIEVREYLTPPDIAELVGDAGLPFDLRHSYTIGNGYFNELLITSWEPGSDEVLMWGFDVKEQVAWGEGGLEPLGTLEEFLASLPARATLRSGTVLSPDSTGRGALQDLVDLVEPAPQELLDPVASADQGGDGDADDDDDDGPTVPPPGIQTTEIELLGRLLNYLGELTLPLPDTHPAYAGTCRHLRATLLAMHDRGMVDVTADRTELSVEEAAAHEGFATPGSAAWRPDGPDGIGLHDKLATSYDREFPEADGRIELPPAIEVDPNFDDLDEAVLDAMIEAVPAASRQLLGEITAWSAPYALGWARPAVGTDGPDLAATLAHARNTVRELYRAGYLRFSVLAHVDASDIPTLLAEDRYWSTWCDDVAVHTTPAGAELGSYR